MRVIHTFQYYNKTFKAWDLTVWDYWLYLRSPSEALEKILTEFNRKMPRMNPEHLARFQDVLFSTDNSERLNKVLDTKTKSNPKKEREKIKNAELDFHVEVGMFCFFLHQSYEEVLRMPLWVYHRMWKDMKYISWKEELPKDRNKTTLDSPWLIKALKTN